MQVQLTPAEQLAASIAPWLLVLLALVAMCASLLAVWVLRSRRKRRDSATPAPARSGDGPPEIAASDNPYASPRAAAPPPLPPDIDELTAQRWIRWTVVLLTPTAAINLLAFVASGAAAGTSSPLLLFYIGNSFLGVMALLTLPPLFWLRGVQVVDFVAGRAHRLLGGRVPRDDWLRATRAALWPLPYAAALGSLVWLVFTAGGAVGLWLFYPWYVLCGTLGHLLGAWCYLTVFWHWFRVRRRFAAAPTLPGNRPGGALE